MRKIFFSQTLKISREYYYIIWRLPSPSELTPLIFNIELTHLGSEAYI